MGIKCRQKLLRLGLPEEHGANARYGCHHVGQRLHGEVGWPAAHISIFVRKLAHNNSGCQQGAAASTACIAALHMQHGIIATDLLRLSFTSVSMRGSTEPRSRGPMFAHPTAAHESPCIKGGASGTFFRSPCALGPAEAD